MRKVTPVVIAADNRDKGKTFVITEMGSLQAFNWCARAMLSLAQSGTNVEPGTLANIAKDGPEVVASLGLTLFTQVPESVAMPLLAEARACVSYQPPDARIASQPIYGGDLCQIEEVSTWTTLLTEVFKVHLGFSAPAQSPTTV